MRFFDKKADMKLNRDVLIKLLLAVIIGFLIWAIYSNLIKNILPGG